MDKRHELGRRGEDLAAKHLADLGYRVLGRNLVNCIGELDLVAEDGRTVVIVEVKTRSHPGRAPGQAVGYRKQRQLTLAAAMLLKDRRWSERPARFDVIEVICPPGGAPIIRHLKNAFEAVSY